MIKIVFIIKIINSKPNKLQFITYMVNVGFSNKTNDILNKSTKLCPLG